MIDPLRKQQLEDCYFQDDDLPDDLSKKETAYINTLSLQWNQALLRLYGVITKRDEGAPHINEG